jgi:hypothetical protein
MLLLFSAILGFVLRVIHYTWYIHKNKRAGHKTMLHLHNFVIKNSGPSKVERFDSRTT